MVKKAFKKASHYFGKILFTKTVLKTEILEMFLNLHGENSHPGLPCGANEIGLCFTYVYVLNNDSMYVINQKNQCLSTYELKIGGPLYKVFSPVNEAL